jgi:hypothetical protein
MNVPHINKNNEMGAAMGIATQNATGGNSSALSNRKDPKLPLSVIGNAKHSSQSRVNDIFIKVVHGKVKSSIGM